ncbi:hypothetical protein [Thalassotalea sp. PS06]|uniref:hypothetical protein n=1 Tax=Thalassotalea sp. PS06 TaxID=2594005 RepID=UPI00116352BB|nr:hypothetical protein [Thalassotalea sp. PS06]QDP00145.1 hypothetical protein FNC98_01550 [Thalassotalea sp. PS06]
MENTPYKAPAYDCSTIKCPSCGSLVEVQKEPKKRSLVIVFFVALGFGLLFWILTMFSLGVYAGVSDPQNAEMAGQQLGERFAIPGMLGSLLLAIVLAFIGFLPGTKKKS